MPTIRFSWEVEEAKDFYPDFRFVFRFRVNEKESACYVVMSAHDIDRLRRGMVETVAGVREKYLHILEERVLWFVRSQKSFMEYVEAKEVLECLESVPYPNRFVQLMQKDLREAERRRVVFDLSLAVQMGKERGDE